MGSQRDEDRFSRSTSDASIDAQALQPSADTGSQLQAMRSSSGTTEKGSKSRKTTNYDKDLEPTATGSPLSSDSPRKLKGAKPRRVRTGCFTCRERHLKCDEALHRCQNCRKSGRVCRRGVRLNFIDTQTVAPPYCIPRRSGSQVTIQDDSRLIASEYVGGFERYPPPAPISPPGQDSASPFEFPDGLGDDMLFESSIFMDDPFQSTFQPSQSGFPGILFNEQPSNHTSFPDQLISHTAFPSTEQVTHNYCSSRTFFNKSAETRFMQSFVEEVGCWMDLMDTANHV